MLSISCWLRCMGALIVMPAFLSLCGVQGSVLHNGSSGLTLEKQVGEGNVLDVSCEPGYENQGNVCKPCPENHFKDRRGDQLCQPCTDREITYAVELCPCLPTQNRVLGCKGRVAIPGTSCHDGPHSKLMAGCPVKSILRKEDLQVTETLTLSVSPSSSYAPTTAGTGNLTLSTSSPATMTDPVWDGSGNHMLPDKGDLCTSRCQLHRTAEVAEFPKPGSDWSVKTNMIIIFGCLLVIPTAAIIFHCKPHEFGAAAGPTKPNEGAETESDIEAGNTGANSELRRPLLREDGTTSTRGSADVQPEEPARYNPMPSTKAQWSTPHNELDPFALGNGRALSSSITPSCRIDGASGGPDPPCAPPSRGVTQGSEPWSGPACRPAPGSATSPHADSVTTGSGPTSEARSYPEAHSGAQPANAASGSLAEEPVSQRSIITESIASHASSDSGRQDSSATVPKTVWYCNLDEQGVQEQRTVTVMNDLKEHEAQSRTSLANLSEEAGSPGHASVYSTNAAAESVAMSSCVSVPEPIQVADSSHSMLNEMPTSS